MKEEFDLISAHSNTSWLTGFAACNDFTRIVRLIQDLCSVLCGFALLADLNVLNLM